APLRGRPGLRRAFPQVCRPAGRIGRDFATVISRSNSFVPSCSSPSVSGAYFDTRPIVPFVMPFSRTVALLFVRGVEHVERRGFLLRRARRFPVEALPAGRLPRPAACCRRSGEGKGLVAA